MRSSGNSVGRVELAEARRLKKLILGPYPVAQGALQRKQHPGILGTDVPLRFRIFPRVQAYLPAQRRRSHNILYVDRSGAAP